VTGGRLPTGLRSDAIACLLASAVFCLLTLQNLYLPGPHTDELFTAAPAVNFVEGTNNTRPMQIDPSIVHIAGRPLPLMVMTYVGAVQTFLYIPAFYLLGDSLATVRIVPIAIGILALWCSYLFWKSLYNRATAVLATIFLVADPSFVFFVGRDFGPPGIALLCKMGGLLLLLRWWRESRPWNLYLAAFALGIAVYHKADFLWILAAAVTAGILFYRDGLRARLTWRRTLGSAAVFALSAAPFLLMNLLTAGATFRLLAPQTSFVEQIRLFFTSLGVRAGQVIDMMTGVAPYQLFMGGSPADLSPYAFILPILVLGGCVSLATFAAQSRQTAHARRAWFVLTFMTLIFLQTAKTPTALMAHHMMALYPLLQGAGAAGIVLLVERVRRNYRIGILAATSCIAAFPGLAASESIHRALETTGGTGYWSDAIYDLTPFLESRRRPVALMQWGFTSNLIVLSQGRLTLRRVYKDLLEHGTRPELVDPYIRSSDLYLFYTEDEEESRTTFEALRVSAARQGFTPEEIQSFHQRDGREIYAVYQLRRFP
jgi:4-amino-4-deoxy-L-arabinose transferase-like glycosyltransferase